MSIGGTFANRSLCTKAESQLQMITVAVQNLLCPKQSLYIPGQVMALKGLKVVKIFKTDLVRSNSQVLELAGLAPAPVCGMILADHGAEVLRIDKVPTLSTGISINQSFESLTL